MDPDLAPDPTPDPTTFFSKIKEAKKFIFLLPTGTLSAVIKMDPDPH
jgi:hypothetical protein